MIGSQARRRVARYTAERPSVLERPQLSYSTSCNLRYSDVVREMIDREREARHCRRRGGAPSLVVMIGRRRVGKSFLLARTFTGAADRVLPGR